MYPVWGSHVEAVYKSSGVYDKYVHLFHQLFFMVDEIADAELVIVPGDYKHYKKQNRLDILRNIVDLCKAQGKYLLLFYKSDEDGQLSVEYERLLVFRTSLYNSTRQPNEFAMPVWSGDVIAEAARLGIGTAALSGHLISFCGQGVAQFRLAYAFKFVYYHFVKFWFPKFFCSNKFLSRYFSFLRQDVLGNLEQSGLDTSFIVRNSYFGGAWQGWGKFDLDTYEKARYEYLENMAESQFVLCVRGGGNYSLRFYEAMAMGKIPILIDTDCVLPFDKQIDWDQHCIRVPIQNLNRLKVVIQGWPFRQHSQEVGARNRHLWEEWLTPESFFTRVHDQLRLNIDRL